MIEIGPIEVLAVEPVIGFFILKLSNGRKQNAQNSSDN